MTQVTRKTTTESSWEDIRDDSLPVGTVVTVELKNGTKQSFEVAAVDTYGAKKVLACADCLPEKHRMNPDWTNKGGWSKSEMRNKTMAEILDLLPDDLQAIIKPRTIKQKLNGRIAETEDKIWLLSVTEVFGAEAYGSDADVDDIHFPLYDTEKSRVKEVEGDGTWSWWLRSPNTGSSISFWSVYTSGSSYASAADTAYGVAFGFLI